MMKWKIEVGRGFGFGIGLMSFVTLVNAVLIGVAASRPISLATFVVALTVVFGFLLAGLIAYWVYGLTNARYLLDRNALVIAWGTSKQVIPTGHIERVFTGDEIEGRLHFYGGRWPGHWVGYGELPGGKQALFYATQPPQQQVFIVTPGLVYGISPAQQVAFLESLTKRLEMGPTQAMEQSSRRPPILDWTIWRDPLGLSLLGAATAGLVLLLGVLTVRYPTLPMLIPLHFGASGSPDRLGPRVAIFLVPMIGLLTLLTNGALGALSYRHNRLVSYMLWGSSVLVQVLIWTATFGILSHI